MWSNTLNSELVKDFVNLGTIIVKIIDKIGLLNVALIALATRSMIKNKNGPIAFLGGISDIIRGVVSKVGRFIGSLTGMTAATSSYTAETLAASVANGTLSASEAASIATKNGLALATTSVTAAEATEMLTRAGVSQADALAMVTKLGLTNSTQDLALADIQAAVASGALTLAQGAQIASALGLTVANKGLAASAKALWTALWPILAVMGGIIAIRGIVKWIDNLVVTTEELTEELSNLRSELQDIESEIDSLNGELKSTQERMAELIAMPSLSFVEQEELENLKAQTAELERQLELQNMLKQSKEQEIIDKSEEYIDRIWNDKGSDRAYHVDSDGVITKDSMWTYGHSTKMALDTAMNRYLTLTELLEETEDLPTENRDDLEQQLANISSGINMVFADEEFDALKYGMSDEIDAFLDELYAYQAKWQEIQGISDKSSIIASIFD